MLLRKSFSDARCLTTSGARDVTMLLCHLIGESEGGGHFSADKALVVHQVQMNSTKK